MVNHDDIITRLDQDRVIDWLEEGARARIANRPLIPKTPPFVSNQQVAYRVRDENLRLGGLNNRLPVVTFPDETPRARASLAVPPVTGSLQTTAIRRA